ncbi:MAG: hypothetical protein QW056_06895 [Candidatus Bathyarchaeia archaeon]
MEPLIDDIGSFPLPAYVDRRNFEKAYSIAREAMIKGRYPKDDELLFNSFYKIVSDSFRKKLEAGLDVANYPQHYDMYRQFADPVHKAMEEGTYIVDEKEAIIPEVHVIAREAKTFCEEMGKEKITLRVCVTGPMELYLREVGTTLYRDVLFMLAETVRNFARTSIISTKYLETRVVSIDEPSFGFQEIHADQESLLEALERAFDFRGVVKQIHLHSPSRIPFLLDVKNLDVVSIEYAASPKNIEYVSKVMLEKADKQIRVGVSRTDIDNITAELHQKGVTKPSLEQLIESKEIIRRRYIKAKEKYGERLTFTGPDCGLGGWPNQEAAQNLLKRTVEAVKNH